jgi:hypothetical protein
MPLVIPQTGPVQYVPTDEILGEILGHDNFDGETWAVGDRLIFEAGTESRINRTRASCSTPGTTRYRQIWRR